jgi:hypothetical protein
MEAIKGNIGAIPDFTVTVVFSSQLTDKRSVLRVPGLGE